jgi:hypothetical protein
MTTRQNMHRIVNSIVLTFVALILAAFPAMSQGKSKSVKVFILAGQSNMEGKSKVSLWDHQAKDPNTKEFFAHLREGDKWVKRGDVFIKFLGRHGNLTVG